MARMTVASAPGTGSITLGSAVLGYQTFAASGAANGQVLSYGIRDGNDFEVGRAPYSSTGPTLGRGPLFSSNGNAAINASASAIVYITLLAEDLQPVIVSKSSNYAVQSGDSGTLFDNTGAVSEVDFTLPPAAAGLGFVFTVVVAQIVKIIANGADKIAVGSSNSIAGGSIQSAAPFSVVKLYSSNLPAQWIAENAVGPWQVT